MKNRITLFLLSLIALPSLAAPLKNEHPTTTTDTIWYNGTWQKTDRDKAVYYRTVVKTDAGWQVADHFLSGTIQMTGGYADDSFHISQGEFKWFDKKGVITHSETYANGKANGKEVYYYPNGKVNATGDKKDGKEQGEWVGYYPNGKVSAKATYDTGRQVSATFYTEDGSRNKEMNVFLRNASYPGGPAKYLRWLNKTLRYPDSAFKHEKQGMVIVSFKVAKDGTLSHFVIDQSVDKDLDKEALRVLQLMPEWEPAIVGGVYSDSYQRQPVVFRLEAQ